MYRLVMETFADVINLWPSTGELAGDIGVTTLVVRQMRNRDSIDSAYWAALVAGAQKRQIEGVTLELLAHLAAKRKGRAA